MCHRETKTVEGRQRQNDREPGTERQSDESDDMTVITIYIYTVQSFGLNWNIVELGLYRQRKGDIQNESKAKH